METIDFVFGASTGSMVVYLRQPVSVNILAALIVHEFVSCTLRFPLTKPEEIETEILFVPWPDEIVVPGGAVHLYPVAPGTVATE